MVSCIKPGRTKRRLAYSPSTRPAPSPAAPSWETASECRPITSDPDVFIRSVATRGAHGGLAAVARAGVRLLEAVGKSLILVETVGVGQTELDVVGIADQVVVVLVPESGDTVQAMKAGILEIADIFVVNKADRDGAGQLVTALNAMVSLSHGPT